MKLRIKPRTGTALVIMSTAALALGGCSGSDDESNDPATVKTQQGDIHGTVAASVVSFKGIPYAAPPVGDLRWKPPAPAAARNTTLQADKFGPSCQTQEDCLY